MGRAFLFVAETEDVVSRAPVAADMECAECGSTAITVVTDVNEIPHPEGRSFRHWEVKDRTPLCGKHDRGARRHYMDGRVEGGEPYNIVD